MGLRLKIFLPSMITALLLSGFMFGIWLPDFEADSRSRHLAHHRNQVAIAAKALVPALLSRDLSTVYNTLDQLIADNRAWVSLALFDDNGVRVYPLDETIPDEAAEIAQIHQQIRYLDQSLGRLQLNVDMGPTLQQIQTRAHRLALVACIALAIAAALVSLVVDRLVRKPLADMAQASRRLVDGDYDAPLPAAWGDEMGSLVNHFDAMRRSIQQNHQALADEAAERRAAERTIEREYQIERALGDILKVSLEPVSLDESLDRILDTVMALPWLSLEPRGCIFLAQPGEGVLVMRAQRNLPRDIQAQCSIVPFGKCLCGQAARCNQPVYASELDERHEIRFPGMEPHGHLVVPIAMEDTVIGVLNLYVDEGFKSNSQQDRFLEALADLLAGVIRRKQMEETLRHQARIIEQTNDSVVSMDMDGYITSWNPGAERNFGYCADEVLGQHISIIYPATQHAFLEHKIITPLLRKGRHEVDFSYQRRDGQRLDIHFSLSLYYGSDAKPAGILGYGTDISRRKQMERALRDSEERFRTLVEATSDWVWEVDRNGVYTYASPRVYPLLGYEPEEVVGKTPFDLMPADEARRLEEAFSNIVQSESPFEQLENVNLHCDGHEVVLETSGVPFFDEQGRLLGYRGIDRDITSRKAAERALLESETKYRALMENASDAILLAVPGGRFVEANQQAEQLLGYTRTEILQLTPLDIHPTDEHDDVRAAFEDITTKGRSLHEHTVVGKNGERVPVEVAGTLVSYGEQTLALGIFRDITERKQAEERLRQLNEELEESVRERTLEVQNQKLAMDEHSIVGVTDHSGKIIYVNDKFCAISQYSGQELLGEDHRILNSGTHPRSFFRRLWRTIGKGQIWHGEIRNRRKDGSCYWVDTTIVPFLNDQGKPYQYVSIRTDITELKENQEAQRQRQQRLDRQQTALMRLAKGNLLREERIEPIIRSITENGVETLLVDRVSVWFGTDDNQHLECIDCYNRASAGHDSGERLARADYPRFFAELEDNRILVADDAHGDLHFKGLGSAYLQRHDVTAVMSVPVRLDGQAIGVVCFEQIARARHWHSDEQQFAAAIADLIALATEQTGRRQAEAKLAEFAAQLERTNTELSDALERAQEATRVKSEFLATMSHEIRTPLNGVLGMLSLMSETEMDNEQKEYVEIADKSASSLLELLDNVLDYSRLESGNLGLECVEFSPQAAADEVVLLMQSLASDKGITLQCEFQHRLDALVLGDPTRFRQILVNLVSNAIKFTREGGVAVSAEVLHDTGDHVEMRFTVRDTGMGIAEDKQRIIFESFTQADGSTTREFGGTGLGLAICKQLVDLMGGQMGLESAPGEGSAFWFNLTLKKVSKLAPTHTTTGAQSSVR